MIAVITIIVFVFIISSFVRSTVNDWIIAAVIRV
jgi:hypothetical protein